MKTNKIIGLILVVAGFGLAFWGYQMSETLASAVSSRLTGSMPDEVMYRYVGGGVLAALGAFLVMKN